LSVINQLDLLQQLYSRIIISKAVYLKLINVSFSVAGAMKAQIFHWIEIRQIENCTMVEALCLEIARNLAQFLRQSMTTLA
jgi:predicted nucleic acid-binding protein